MSSAFRLRALGWALAVACGAGCTVRLPAEGTGPARFALYDGRYAAASGEQGRFRLLLVAMPPDRLRIEVFGPLGGTWLRLEGSSRGLLVVSPRERRAWIGAPEPELTARLLGVALPWESWAALALGGELPPTPRLRREPERGSDLPRRVELTTVEGLRIELRQRGRTRTSGTLAVGEAHPPAGYEVEPLDAWRQAEPIFVPR